jgi:DNA-binding NtrC family response regulator
VDYAKMKKMQNKSKILIVDDQLGPRESMKMILKDRYVVATATGAKEAFRYMAESPVDLVLLDIKMPKIDGITALAEIKKKYPHTEVILLTAHVNFETLQKAIKLGAFGCLMKPFDKNELLQMVDKALKNQWPKKTA